MCHTVDTFTFNVSSISVARRMRREGKEATSIFRIGSEWIAKLKLFGVATFSISFQLI